MQGDFWTQGEPKGSRESSAENDLKGYHSDQCSSVRQRRREACDNQPTGAPWGTDCRRAQQWERSITADRDNK